MNTSAGILIIWNQQALLAHPTNSRWNMYMPPKGAVEKGESFADAAIRETFEEIGIHIDQSKLSDSFEIIYQNNKGKTIKRVHVFPVCINSLNEINLQTAVVPTEQLQLEEIDDARFMSFLEVEEKCFYRYRDLIKTLITK